MLTASHAGREAALQFAAWGANLILACRRPPPHETHPYVAVQECRAAAEAAGHTITVEWWELDMSSLASISAFAARWNETGKQIDILCNNAGMGSSPSGSTAFYTKDGFEIVHQVNFLSHVLLTMSVLPSVAKAAEPRIIFTTSCFHYPGKFELDNWNGEKPGSGGLGGVQFYQNSKLALQTWLTELQHKCATTDGYRHITVQGVHPGYVNSGIWNMNNKGWGETAKEVLLKTLAWFLAINPQQGSMAIVHAATAAECGPDPKVQGVGKEGGKSGRYWNRVWAEEPMPHTRDPDCRCRVWRKANEELKLQDKGLLKDLRLECDGK